MEEGVVYFVSAMTREALATEQVILVDRDGSVLETGISNEEFITQGDKLKFRCPQMYRMIDED